MDYEERLYAAGRIPGSFFRREGRPSEQAILLRRLVDRPLRPLFPKDMRNDVQVIVTALASDPEHHPGHPGHHRRQRGPDDLGHPLGRPDRRGARRLRRRRSSSSTRPSTQMASSTLDLRMAGTADAILMVEAGADEIPEDIMLEALRLGHEAMQPIIELQNKMRDQLGKPKFEYTASSRPMPAVQDAAKAAGWAIGCARR